MFPRWVQGSFFPFSAPWIPCWYAPWIFLLASLLQIPIFSPAALVSLGTCGGKVQHVWWPYIEKGAENSWSPLQLSLISLMDPNYPCPACGVSLGSTCRDDGWGAWEIVPAGAVGTTPPSCLNQTQGFQGRKGTATGRALILSFLLKLGQTQLVLK